MVTYTYRYSSGVLNPNSASTKDRNVGINMPTRISAGVGYHPCFFTFYLYDHIDCKITIFPDTYMFIYFFENIIILAGKFAHVQERRLACASTINYWNTHKPVCFILSYVLFVTQQYKQRTA